MFCSNCGKTVKEGAKFCPFCGAQTSWNESATTPESQATYSPVQQITPATPAQEQSFVNRETITKRLKCPSCGSRNLQSLTQTTSTATTTGGGYSGTKGCLGWLLFGPFGLLCGTCGSKQTTTLSNSSQTFWVCCDCGQKFRNLTEWKKEIETGKKVVNYNFICAACVFLVGLLFTSIGQGLEAIGILFITLSVVQVLLALVLYFKTKNDTASYEALERNALG